MSEKSGSYHGVFVFLLFVLIACLAISLYWYNKKYDSDVVAPNKVSHKKVIHVGGSGAVFPLFKTLAHEFEKKNPDYKVAFYAQGHTKSGIMGVVSGEYDLGLMSRNPLPEEEKLDFHQIPVALDGLAFVVHSGVKVRNLTRQQLLDIYAGKITDWNMVGGDDRKIVVLDRHDHTSAKKALLGTLFPPGFKVSQRAIHLESPKQMSEALQYMVNAIGYTSFRDGILTDPELTVLSVDGIFPSPTMVEKRVYPFIRKYSLAVSANPGKDLMCFFEFIFGGEGAKIIEQAGFSPITMDLVIATIPEQDILKQENRYRPLIDYLQEKLGSQVGIRLRHLPSYQDVVREFVSGNVNAAFLGSMTYGIVQAKVGAVVVARPEKGGVSQYRGLLLVRADSGIKGWRDMKGKSISMIKATTAADIFPKLFFKQRGVDDLDKFLGSVHYVGGHEESVEMVEKGKVDVAAAKDLIFKKMVRENPALGNKLTVMAASDPVPENGLVIRRDLDIACYNCHYKYVGGVEETEILCNYLEKELQRALIDLEQDPRGREILKTMGADRFLITTDEDYRNLYRMAEGLGMDLSRYPLD